MLDAVREAQGFAASQLALLGLERHLLRSCAAMKAYEWLSWSAWRGTSILPWLSSNLEFVRLRPPTLTAQ
jgi:hypothetical protein